MAKTETMTNGADRRSLFCCFYAGLGDVAEAARRAGYPAETAAADGAEILRKPACRRMVERFRAVLQEDSAALVRTGLQRLAFGQSNDAVKLLLSDTPLSPDMLGALDLYHVSSIKRDKSGGMEIHFFDRLKALASLYEYSGDADGKAAAHALIAALSNQTEEA